MHEYLVDHNAYPTPLGFAGYPKSVCASVNEVVLHGIPDSRILRMGDVCKLDVSCFIGGVHGDNCATFVAGASTDQRVLELIQFTKKVLLRTIDKCGPGVPFADIGAYIEPQAVLQGYTVNHQYGGHGIGEILHMRPMIFHFKDSGNIEGDPDRGTCMQPGHVFTIEPAISLGSSTTELREDNWTVVNVDGGIAVQEEHMVLITETGREILTV